MIITTYKCDNCGGKFGHEPTYPRDLGIPMFGEFCSTKCVIECEEKTTRRRREAYDHLNRSKEKMQSREEKQAERQGKIDELMYEDRIKKVEEDVVNLHNRLESVIEVMDAMTKFLGLGKDGKK
jgi:hypothetical protein